MEGDVLAGMFDGGWWTILVGFVITPGLVTLSKILMDWVSRIAASLRLKHDPLYDEGSILRVIREGSREVYGRCRVHSIEPGRIEFRGLDEHGEPDGTAMSWPVRKFVERFESVAEVSS